MANEKIIITNGWQERWFHFAMWVAIITAIVLFLRAVEPILLPFVLGSFVAYLMDPLAVKLEKLKLSRGLASAIITFALFAVIVLLCIWLAPLLYDQIARLASKAPTLLHDLELAVRDKATPVLSKLNALSGADADAIPADASDLFQRGTEMLGNFTRSIITSGAAFINLAGLLLITPIVCFYLIRDWPSVLKRADSMLPLAYGPTIRQQLFEINRTLSSYVRGQITVIFFMTLFYVGGLTLAGLNFSLVLGFLAGVIIIVPYIGSAISVSLGLIVANGQFGTEGAFWVVVTVYAIGQILESQILTPKIIGDRVGLHPLWMLFGMLAGAVLLGFVGVLLAVPMTAVIGVLAKFAVGRYLQSSLYLDQ